MSADVWEQFIQNPELIAKAAKVSLECLEVIVKCIADRQTNLKLLIQKTDQMILREIDAAFDALNEARNAPRASSFRNRRLTFAENKFLINTNLNKTLSTGNHPNTYWMAQAHYGLAVVCALRSEQKMASHPAELCCGCTTSPIGTGAGIIRPYVCSEMWGRFRLAQIGGGAHRAQRLCRQDSQKTNRGRRCGATRLGSGDRSNLGVV
jgi:hypothetical protein